MLKICGKCHVARPIERFSKNALGKYGVRNICKECYNTTKNTPASLACLKDKRRNRLEWRANAAFGSLKRSASKRDLELLLDVSWIVDKYRKGVCDATGIPFVFDYEKDQFTVKTRSNREMNPFSPSIERKDSSKGYTEDNCIMVVFMYNLAKNSFSEQALEMFCRAYLNKIDN